MLIINPYSGRGISKARLGDIVLQLSRSDYVVTAYFTKERDTCRLAREHGGEYDLVVCCGGDGTLSDVIAGLTEVPAPPPIGYIPAGTANDVASTLALSRDTTTAVATILAGKSIPLDVGRFGDAYFTYIAAFGAFTSASYETSQPAKRALGHMAYVFGGIGSVAAIKPKRTVVEYDGGRIEDDLVFGGVTNSTSVAGLVRLDPNDVSLGDGKFEVILVKNPINVTELYDIFAGIATKRYESDSIKMLHTSRVKFTFDEPVAWTRDGESGGEFREISVTNIPRAVRIIIPTGGRKVTPTELYDGV
jgi:YegS/Rv2252/BmrU family lipid kinase